MLTRLAVSIMKLLFAKQTAYWPCEDFMRQTARERWKVRRYRIIDDEGVGAILRE